MNKKLFFIALLFPLLLFAVFKSIGKVFVCIDICNAVRSRCMSKTASARMKIHGIFRDYVPLLRELFPKLLNAPDIHVKRLYHKIAGVC